MSRDEVEQLRITPHLQVDSALLPEPRVLRASAVNTALDTVHGTDGGDHGVLYGEGRAVVTELAPDAIVRELRDADLHSAGGVADLLRVLGLDSGQHVLIADLGLVDGLPVPDSSPPPVPLIVEAWESASKMVGAIASPGPGSTRLGGAILPETGSDDDFYLAGWWCGDWRQISRRLRLVRAAVNHYVAHREGSDPSEAWNVEGFTLRVDHRFVDSLPEVLAELGQNPEVDAWKVFVAVHAQFLRDHMPRLSVTLKNRRAAIDAFAWPNSLATALMVQLHNMMVEGLAIRRCRNEACRRPFTRQRGRAEKGQFKTSGVAYCDAACAKAQAQREYRRRNRQPTNAAGSAARPMDRAGAEPRPIDSSDG